MPIKFEPSLDAVLDAAALDWDALSRLMADDCENRGRNPLFMVLNPEPVDISVKGTPTPSPR